MSTIGGCFHFPGEFFPLSLLFLAVWILTVVESIDIFLSGYWCYIWDGRLPELAIKAESSPEKEPTSYNLRLVGVYEESSLFSSMF